MKSFTTETKREANCRDLPQLWSEWRFSSGGRPQIASVRQNSRGGLIFPANLTSKGFSGAFFFLIVWRLFATLHMGRAGLLLWIVQVPYFPDQPRWRCGSDVSRTLLVQCQTNRFPQFAQIQNNNRAPYRFVARDAIAGDAADRLFVSWRDCSGINLLSFGQQLVAFIILSF